MPTRVHATVQKMNVIGHLAHFEIAVQGVEFPDKKFPANYPLSSIHQITEFTLPITPCNNLTIAQIFPGKTICLLLNKTEEEDWRIDNIGIENDRPNLAQTLDNLQKL